MTFHALVVDDNLDVLEEVQDRLESLGHTCDVAETQADATTLLEHRRFSYALLDLEIPGGEHSMYTVGRHHQRPQVRLPSLQQDHRP